MEMGSTMSLPTNSPTRSRSIMGAGSAPSLVLPNATVIQAQQNRNDPNPANLQTGTNVGDNFCDKTNRGVFMCTSAAGVAFYIANVEKPPSSSLHTLSFIAGACGFGFVGSTLGLVLAKDDKNLKLVKFFTIVGTTGAFDMIVLALADICYPDQATWIGAMASILPLFALGERLFGFSAHLLTHIKSAYTLTFTPLINCIKRAFTPLLDRIKRPFTSLMDRTKRAFTSLMDRTKRASGCNPSLFPPPV